MKPSRFYLSLVSLLLVPVAFAAGPVEKRADSYYSKLWTNSPFTVKPVIVDGPTRDPFEDYALSAVMPLPRGGYMVVIQNKKKPDDRVTILPDQPSDFKVEEVRKGDGKPRSMTVQLSQGSMKGVVSFDEKLLVIKQAVQKNPNGQQQGGPGNPNNPNNPMPTPNQGNPGAPNVVVNNPGNPGAPAAGPSNFHQGGGGNPNFNAAGGNGGNNNNSSGASAVRPPRPRVIPSQGGGGGRR